jgi:hypothetical protein
MVDSGALINVVVVTFDETPVVAVVLDGVKTIDVAPALDAVFTAVVCGSEDVVASDVLEPPTPAIEVVVFTAVVEPAGVVVLVAAPNAAIDVVVLDPEIDVVVLDAAGACSGTAPA